MCGLLLGWPWMIKNWSIITVFKGIKLVLNTISSVAINGKQWQKKQHETEVWRCWLSVKMLMGVGWSFPGSQMKRMCLQSPLGQENLPEERNNPLNHWTEELMRLRFMGGKEWLRKWLTLSLLFRMVNPEIFGDLVQQCGTMWGLKTWENEYFCS